MGPDEDEEKTPMEKLTEDMVERVKVELGPIFKSGDDKALQNIVETVRDEAFQLANRMLETTMDFRDLKSCIFKASVIAYENRGIEGQTRQQELGQELHFIDWHDYLRDTVITHGKRFVI